MVGGRDPQGPVGGLYGIPNAPDLPVEELLPIHDFAAVVQLQAPEPLSAEGGHEEVAFILPTPALDRGPAVVLPGFDPVDLIPGASAELARVESSLRVPSEPLHVAVAVGIDGVAGERVVRWNGTIGLYPQDLASQRVPVLGVPGLSCVARAHVEHPVGAELAPTPVAIRVGGDARQYGLRALAHAEPYDPVVYPGRVVGVDVAVILVVGGDGDAEKPTLARATFRQRLDLLNVA